MARPKLSDISLEALRKELARRESKVEQLKAERDKLDKLIAELEGEAQRGKPRAVKTLAAVKKIARIPGKAVRATRGGGKPLAQYLREALAGSTNGMDLKQIEQAVRAAGYPTTAKTIYNPILKVIRRDNDFVKLDRGLYALKADASAAGKPRMKPGPKPGKKPGQKPGSVTGAEKKTAAKAKAKGAGKRKKYSQTAEDFIHGLVEGKGASTTEINKAWIAAGRPGRADNTLNKMVKAGKLTRAKVSGERGSIYKK